MTLLFIEGYDVYNDSTELSGKWDSVTGTMIFQSPGRLGVHKSLRYSSADITEKTISNQATVVIGFGFKMVATPVAGSIIEFDEGGVQQARVAINTARKLEVYDAADALQGTQATALTVGVWYYIEIKLIVSNTGSVEVKQDGTQIINATSIDVQNSANVYTDNVKVTGISSSFDVDDLYLLDSVGSINTDFLGDSRVDPYLPNAADTTVWSNTGGGANYLDVDDNPPDDDTSYVYSANSGDIDYYGVEDLPTAVTTVHGVQVVGRARKLDAGTRQIKLKIKSGANIQDSAAISLSTGYLNYINITETSDGATTAWTKSTADAALVGLEVV